jgi:hypothetical protein
VHRICSVARPSPMCRFPPRLRGAFLPPARKNRPVVRPSDRRRVALPRACGAVQPRSDVFSLVQSRTTHCGQAPTKGTASRP